MCYVQSECQMLLLPGQIEWKSRQHNDLFPLPAFAPLGSCASLELGTSDWATKIIPRALLVPIFRLLVTLDLFADNPEHVIVAIT